MAVPATHISLAIISRLPGAMDYVMVEMIVPLGTSLVDMSLENLKKTFPQEFKNVYIVNEDTVDMSDKTKGTLH